MMVVYTGAEAAQNKSNTSLHAEQQHKQQLASWKQGCFVLQAPSWLSQSDSPRMASSSVLTPAATLGGTLPCTPSHQPCRRRKSSASCTA